MRKFIVIFFCLFITNAFAVAQKKILPIQHWKTKVGSNVYLVRIPNLPMIDIRVIFAAGSAYDGKKAGLASMTNNMVGEGTDKENASQIAKKFDDLGAQFSTTVGRDKGVASLRSLTKPKTLKAALKEFTHVLADMSILPKAWKRVRNQALAAIKVNQQEPDSVAMTAFYQTVYGDQPYGHNPLGTLSSIQLITRQDVMNFYKRYYVAKNADIVLVGDVTLSHAKQIANRISAALPQGVASPRLKLATAKYSDVHRHIQFTAKQTAILVGQIGINYKNPDYFPLVVGNYIFGGLPLGSILFQQVRNQKGLAYYAGSTFQTLRYRGPFLIQLNTRGKKAKEALSIVKSSLSNFVEQGPSQKQLNAAKQNLIGRFPLAISNNNSIANIVSNIAFYHLPLNYLNTYESKIRAVTADQVKKAFNKVIHPKRLIVITVGPTHFRK